MYGLIIALVILCTWLLHQVYILEFLAVDVTTPLLYVHVLFQAYLFTGLFITAHDAMHGTVVRSPSGNTIIGTIACFLFAGMSFARLKKNHREHHLHPTEGTDPDYAETENFFLWFLLFMYRYTTILQLVVMGSLFNLLALRYNEEKLWILWVLPALLGALQLFYFGTYRPHKKPHTNEMIPHNARSLKRNHIWAMLSCYFFGYHYEHHASPHTPWWKLYALKNEQLYPIKK